uniref:Tyrosine specific protein phosphatases domain-containing protein n=1 Tax=Hyaloperonospora arabidopsidis (strain Emoy2) TaxID=559515 RepID=M4BXN9_HYAAE
MNATAPALIPPFRFSTVQQGLYRGSYPTLKNFRFLRRLGLKTVVSVIPEPPTSDLADFCATEKITLRHFYAEKFTSDNVTVSPTTIAQILDLVVQLKHLPLYLHCLDGANVTGIVVMVLRKLLNWTKLATVSEFCRFTRDHGIEKDESEYLAAFSEEIVIGDDVPEWLWNGVRVTKHPTMIVHQPGLELATANALDAAGNLTNGTPSLKWETEVEKTEAILRQFEEASRNRIGEVADGREQVETVIDDALQDVPLTRSLEALDLAGV